MRRLRRLWLIIPVILLIAIGGFVVWASTPSGVLMQEAQIALESDDQVQVSRDRWLVFEPAATPPTTGLIYYPGGRVQPEAYAPLAREIAKAGYLVVIVPMPLNLAVLGANRADEVIAAFPEIRAWAISGHSLGGSFAANYAAQHPGKVQGLIIMAAYPQASDSLAARDDLVVMSIYGTLDGLARPDQVEGSRVYLPSDAEFVPLDGGNHAQFGWYGAQAGDNEATITRADQTEQIVNAVLRVLQAITPDSNGS
ncbi:MAG: alpha/beta hydrolase [Anaerolineae bacterium]|nr:alpha/beta hydrolase [Anaerolineae bacterium]